MDIVNQTAKTPFLEKVIDCPICEETGRFKVIKSKLFTPGDKESDQHIKYYSWIDPDFQGINPAYYFLWHCPRCEFTDITTDFEEPGRELKNSTIKEHYLHLGKKDKEFLSLIGKHIDIENMTFETAMNMHIAALYIQELPKEQSLKNVLKLGRLYLRAAWLWREVSPQASEEVSQESVAVITRAYRELSNNLDRFQDSIGKLDEVVYRRLKELNATPEQENANPYKDMLNAIGMTLRYFRKSVVKFERVIESDKKGELFASIGKDQGGYSKFPSYIDFLIHLAGYWPKVPTNERDCLVLAVDYYTQAYMNEFDIEEVEKLITTNSLIVDLHIRLGNYEQALRTIGNLYRDGMEQKMELQRKLREKQKEGAAAQREVMQIESKIGRIEYTVSQAAERRREVKELIYQKFLPKSQAIIAEHPGAVPDTIEEFLKEAEVPQEIIEELMERGVISGGGKTAKGEKKKKFGFFG